MRCEVIQQDLSARLDGERADSTMLDRHLAECPDCRAFLDGAQRVRRELRIAPLGEDVPEITPAVVERLGEQNRRPAAPRAEWWGAMSVAASLVVGLVLGGLLATTANRDPSVAEELGDRVLAAQHTVVAFYADLTVEERGWHPAVPVRRYEGTLRYGAPEQLRIDLRDRTTYPDASWVANDLSRVVTRTAEWSTATPPCPRSQLPGCLLDTPRTTGVSDRVPLSGLGAQALDAVVPVHSLHLGGGTDLGTRTTGDGRQVGVIADVAQLRPLLDALVGVGSWRELHPTDPVELWVDAVSFTPRELTVRAGAGTLRQRWALERGLSDPAGEAVLNVRFDPRESPEEVAEPEPPGPLPTAGFVDGEVDLPLPGTLPQGMDRYRSGVQLTGTHDVETVTWTDGRAWLRLRGVEAWSGKRLFGDLGPLVRRVTLPDGRIVYLSGDGQTAAIHTDGIDLVLEGSVGRDVLLDVAASIPVEGRRVPTDWVEAADGSLTDAAAALPGLLVPSGLDGFGPPSVRIGEAQVVIGYAGSGGRELVVTQRAGGALSPPVVSDVIGVAVRGRPGRFLPEAAELEWVEDGVVVSLHSEDLGLTGLLRVAADLRPVP